MSEESTAVLLENENIPKSFISDPDQYQDQVEKLLVEDERQSDDEVTSSMLLMLGDMSLRSEPEFIPEIPGSLGNELLRKISDRTGNLGLIIPLPAEATKYLPLSNVEPDQAPKQPFERVLSKYFSSPSRLKNIKYLFGSVIPDMIDHLNFKKLPPKVESDIYNHQIVEQIIPPKLAQEILARTQNWQVGEHHGMVTIVGQETQTNHPHLFQIKKFTDGVRLIFIDPEDSVGTITRPRPQVVNLAAAFLNSRTGAVDSVISLRYRSADFNRAEELTPQKQYAVARELIPTSGLPTILQGNESQICYRLVLTPNRAILASRHVLNETQLGQFLQQGSGWFPLEAKISSLSAVMDRFTQVFTATDKQKAAYERLIAS